MAPWCPNHPEVAAHEECAQCGQPLCDQCLVEIRGQALCGGCKISLVQDLQHQIGVNPARVVYWARVFDWVLAAPALFWGAVFLIATAWPNPENDFLEFYAVAAVLGLVLPLPPAVALAPNRRWAYYYQMATLTVGALSAGCSLSILGVLLWLPAGILLWYWLRPEVRSYCTGQS